MRTLIINADDFGYEPNVTRGIEQSMREGVVSSATMMVNTPFSAEAVARSAGLKLGLHLNLARWPSVHQPSHEFVEAQAAELTAGFVERETLAQLDLLQSLIGRPATHIDVHKHLHLNASVLQGLIRAAQVRKLPVRSINERMRATLKAHGVVTNDCFIGDAGKDAYWSLREFEAQLATLPTEGVIELMCHPGYAPTAIASGYGIQREGELQTFISGEARAALKRADLTPHSWDEL